MILVCRLPSAPLPLWLALLVVFAGVARSTPVFTLDVALVRGPSAQADSSWQLDVMLLVERSTLPWRDTPEGPVADCRVHITGTRNLATVADTTVALSDDCRPGENLAGQKLPLLVRLPVTPGSLRVTAEVSGAGGAGERDRRITVPEPSGGPVLSGMRLSVMAPEPAESGPFRHGGMRCVPYADLLFNDRLAVIHGFVEAYDLPGTGVEYSLRLLDENQYLVRELVRQNTLPAGRSLMLLEVPVADLPSGAWILEARLELPGGRVLAASRKSFWMLNPGVTELPGRLVEDEFETMPLAELQALWERSSVLADMREQMRWENGDLAERRVFLKEFWEQRDTDTRTRLNEGLAEFRQRLDEANRRYSAARTEGWNTDRGRVLLRHGVPPEVDSNSGGIRFERLLAMGVDASDLLSPGNEDPFSSPAPGDSGSGMARLSPFEIWYYPELMGGSVFVFVDEGGYGDYSLIHSTLPGEYFDPSWTRRLLGGGFLERGR